MTTAVIPAHNEGRVIRRLLEQLVNGADPGETDIIVVANGCTGDAAEAAASCGPPVRVLVDRRARPGHRFAWDAAEEVTGLTRADLDITRVPASLG